jgi:hypothetical protein
MGVLLQELSTNSTRLQERTNLARKKVEKNIFFFLLAYQIIINKYIVDEDSSGAGISKNYCATNSGSPEVKLRFCPWLKLFNVLGGLT